MPIPRPAQPETPSRDAFTIHRSEVAGGIKLAYLRKGFSLNQRVLGRWVKQKAHLRPGRSKRVV